MTEEEENSNFFQISTKEKENIMSVLYESMYSNDIKRACEVIQSNPWCVSYEFKNHGMPLQFIYSNTSKTIDEVNGMLPIIKLLIENGADVNCRTSSSKIKPLHRAAFFQQFKATELLLMNGADPNLIDDSSRTALHYAVKDNIINLLLHFGADVNATDDKNKTPLILFVYNCQVYSFLNSLQMLVDAGADINAKTSEEKSALYYACFNKQLEFAEFLLKRGADISMCSDDGLVPDYFAGNMLHLLMYFDNVSNTRFELEKIEVVIKLLLERGIDVNEQNSKGCTALHNAAASKVEQFIQALLIRGANIHLVDEDGNTPLHLLFKRNNWWDLKDNEYCFRHNLEGCIRLFVEYGSDFEALNNLNVTPFRMYILYDGADENIIKYLFTIITGIEEYTVVSDANISEWKFQHKEYSHEHTLYELAVAVILGYKKIVDRLIDMDYNIDAKDITHVPGFSNAVIKPPLYYAVEMRRYEIARMLVEAGCRVEDIPLFELYENPIPNNEEVNFKLVCLLWKYAGRLISNEFFITNLMFKKSLLLSQIKYALEHAVSRKIPYLFVFCFVIELLSFVDWTQRVSNALLSRVYYEKLSWEITDYHSVVIDELKDVLVCQNMSQFDILTMEFVQLVNFLNGEENFSTFDKLCSSLKNKTKLEYYEHMLLECINLATEKRQLLSCAKDRLNYIFRNVTNSLKFESLPDELSLEILSYLDARQLRKFANRNEDN